MKFSRYNNPNRRNRRKILSRTNADIIATKNMCNDLSAGIKMPLAYYDAQSDALCGKPSRNIYIMEDGKNG